MKGSVQIPVAPELICAWLHGEPLASRACTTNLPEDFRITGAYYDSDAFGNAVVLIGESESFPPVPEGDELPLFTVVMTVSGADETEAVE